MPLVDTGPVPEHLRNAEGIDAGGLPPGLFVADAMHLAVVRSAERHRELITRLAPQRTRLRIAQVMRVGWLAATDEAGLSSDEAEWSSCEMSPRCVQIKEIEQYQLLEDMDVPALNAFARSHTLTGQCRQIERGVEVVVEQSSLSDQLCVRVVDESDCLWTNKGWVRKVQSASDVGA